MGGSRQSARRVAPIVTGLLHPRSVVDIGCGVGTWLAAFRDLGIEDVVGYDGDYVDRSLLQIPAEAFHPVDLNQPLRLSRRFDLAVSLEVGEHLHPERSGSLVADLVAAAPVVLFSAAIPFQGGTDHINERWQDYWAEQFALHGYHPRDYVRPRIWDDPTVEPWYAQNTLLYVSSDTKLPETPGIPLRVVHPVVFQQNSTSPISGREIRRRARATALTLAYQGKERLLRRS